MRLLTSAGDARSPMAELGKRIFDMKVEYAVAQIRSPAYGDSGTDRKKFANAHGFGAALHGHGIGLGKQLPQAIGGSGWLPVDHEHAAGKIQDPILGHAGVRIEYRLARQVEGGGCIGDLDDQQEFVAAWMAFVVVLGLRFGQHGNIGLGETSLTVGAGRLDRQLTLDAVPPHNSQEPRLDKANPHSVRRFLSHFVEQVSVDKLEPLPIKEPGFDVPFHFIAGEAFAGERFGSGWKRRQGCGGHSRSSWSYYRAVAALRLSPNQGSMPGRLAGKRARSARPCLRRNVVGAS